MTFDFMTPDVWNGLVIGVVLIGSSLALLRLFRDLSRPINPPPKRDRNDQTNSVDHFGKA
jgi:hypothetical protein